MTERPGPPSIPWLVHLGQDALYATVGLVVTTTENLPQLVELGRDKVESRLRAPRAIGGLILSQTERRVRKGLASRFGSQPRAEPRSRASSETIRTTSRERPGPPPGPAPIPSPPPPDVVSVVSLAIPEYDSLAASQVVRRLAGLSADELSAVARYENATRGRRTILARISQLQGGTATNPSDPS